MTKGLRIKALREAKGITQEELAKLLKTTKQTISKYEKGIVTNIPSDKIEMLSKILETTPARLMGWDQDQINALTRMQDELSAQEDALEEEIKSRLVTLTTEQLARLNDILGLGLNEKEMADLLDYAKFLISKRKDL